MLHNIFLLPGEDDVGRLSEDGKESPGIDCKGENVSRVEDWGADEDSDRVDEIPNNSSNVCCRVCNCDRGFPLLIGPEPVNTAGQRDLIRSARENPLTGRGEEELGKGV